jgi:hypothetical protein
MSPEDIHALRVRINMLKARLDAIEDALQRIEPSTRLHLGAAVHATLAVRDFLKSFPEFDKNTTALEMLIAALNDAVEHEVVPDMFRVKASAGRKTNTHEQFMRARAVACVELLKAAGLKAGDARSKVASKWANAEVRQSNGSIISAKLIEAWEAEYRAAPVGSAEREQLDFVRRVARSQPRTQAEALELVKAIGRDVKKSQVRPG